MCRNSYFLFAPDMVANSSRRERKGKERNENEVLLKLAMCGRGCQMSSPTAGVPNSGPTSNIIQDSPQNLGFRLLFAFGASRDQLLLT